jgi:hypothetical protein
MEQPQITITKEEVIPYIIKQGEGLSKQVREAKEKYGPRYNHRNNIEMMYEKFGNPNTRFVAEKFADEFLLIQQKKSSLPASVRYVVRDICSAAVNQCFYDKMKRLAEESKREQLANEE